MMLGNMLKTTRFFSFFYFGNPLKPLAAEEVRLS